MRRLAWAQTSIWRYRLCRGCEPTSDFRAASAGTRLRFGVGAGGELKAMSSRRRPTVSAWVMTRCGSRSRFAVAASRASATCGRFAGRTSPSTTRSSIPRHKTLAAQGIWGARGGIRTPTPPKGQRILSPTGLVSPGVLQGPSVCWTRGLPHPRGWSMTACGPQCPPVRLQIRLQGTPPGPDPGRWRT